MYRRYTSTVVLLGALIVATHSTGQTVPQSSPGKSQPTKSKPADHSISVKASQPQADGVKANPAEEKSSINVAAVRPPMENVRLDDFDDKNFTYVTITDCPPKRPGGPSLCNGKVMTLAVPDALRPELKTLRKSDHLELKVDSDGKSISSVALRSRPVTVERLSTVLGITFGLCFLVTTLLTRGHPLKLIIGQDGRYSNSKFQMAVWFSVVIATYLAMVYLRVSQLGWEFLGCVNIPQNLLLLSGMSALTFGGAKAITTNKINQSLDTGHGNPKDPAGVRQNFWTDLVQNDKGAFDIGDVQMLVVTILAVGMYLSLTVDCMAGITGTATGSLPNIDTTILASFGLGQGAYLTKKAAGNAGTS
jgi:hypothetical protein